MSSSETSDAAKASAAAFKRAKIDDSSMMSDKIIGTHSGTFQADEAMGCFMLRQLPTYKNSKIVRSRDLTVLNTCDIVIDVGGVYDHESKKYDHHQRGYDERFDGDGDSNENNNNKKRRCSKLSASGLVYRHYGKDVIKVYYPNLNDEQLQFVYVKLYNSLLEALDAIDTGVEQVSDGTELVYKDFTTGLSSRVGRLNPRWNEESDDNTPINPDKRFLIASDMCGTDFVSVLTKIVESDLPAREIVEKAIKDRYEIDPSGEIIRFPSGGLPWKSFLYEYEKIHNMSDDNASSENSGKRLIKFVLYTDQSGMWRVQAVTVEGKAFENRVSLPESWRGVRDDDLESITNIKGSRFVHAAGFIGGNTYYDGALQMAQTALKQHYNA